MPRLLLLLTLLLFLLLLLHLGARELVLFLRIRVGAQLRLLLLFLRMLDGATAQRLDGRVARAQDLSQRDADGTRARHHAARPIAERPPDAAGTGRSNGALEIIHGRAQRRCGRNGVRSRVRLGCPGRPGGARHAARVALVRVDGPHPIRGLRPGAAALPVPGLGLPPCARARARFGPDRPACASARGRVRPGPLHASNEEIHGQALVGEVPGEVPEEDWTCFPEAAPAEVARGLPLRQQVQHLFLQHRRRQILERQRRGRGGTGRGCACGGRG